MSRNREPPKAKKPWTPPKPGAPIPAKVLRSAGDRHHQRTGLPWYLKRKI